MDDDELAGGGVDEALKLPVIQRVIRHRYSAKQLLALDVATVVFLMAFTRFLVPSQMTTVSGSTWRSLDWAAWMLSALAVLFRRRFPRTTLAFLMVIGFVVLCGRLRTPLGFFTTMAVYSVVVASSRRTASSIVAVVASIDVAGAIVGGGGQVVPAAVGLLALVGVGWLAGENTRASRAYARQRRERARGQAAANEVARAEQVRRAVADERVEIARELHDIVAHAMSVIAVRSGVARMVIDTQPEQAREALGIIETTTRRSLREMRLLVGVLRDADEHPAEMGPAPGLGDVDRLVADMAAAGVVVEVTVDGSINELAPAADLSAYRIVQEALTNVLRHAGPTRAWVRISYPPDEVVIEILDAGPQGTVPPPPSMPRAGGGHGLIGIRERAALFGGHMEAGPCPGGFRVRANLRTSEVSVGDTRGPPPRTEGSIRR